MPRKLPPFSAVKAFEAAARNGSFARAAAELNVTPTAVSQHIKGMEAWLGEVLFERHANGVELSQRAKALLPEATRLLDEIASSFPPIAEEIHTVSVMISAPKPFSDGWLGPHLADFQNENPGITVFLDQEIKPAHLERHGAIDLMISQVPATGDGLLSELLFEDSIIPVCTEQYRDLMGLEHPDRWKSATLLHDSSWEKDWPLWGKVNLRYELDWSSGPRFPNHWLAVEAARQGRGIAMAHTILVAEHLADHSLVALGKEPADTAESYYLVRRRGHRSPAAIQLRAWLLSRIRSAQALTADNAR
nr:LysR substrate-binding domain-containing protein [uncultured Cohaesibacter sp.]